MTVSVKRTILVRGTMICGDSIRSVSDEGDFFAWTKGESRVESTKIVNFVPMMYKIVEEYDESSLRVGANNQ